MRASALPYVLLSMLVAGVSAALARLARLTEGRLPFDYVEDGRAMPVLHDGSRTMCFRMIRTPQRESRYKRVGPFGEQSVHFFKRKG